MRVIIAVIILSSFFVSNAQAFLEPSFRLKALGEDFVGLVPDQYSDIFRNPAYLGQVEGWKILGEYRRDRSLHYNFGLATPSTQLGKFGLVVKEWRGENSNSQEQKYKYIDYYYIPSYLVLTNNYSQREDITKNRGLDFLYSCPLISDWKLGLSVFYDELKSEFEAGFINLSTTVDFDTFLVLAEREAISLSSLLSSNKSTTVSIGIVKAGEQNSSLDFKLAYRHFNSELGTFEERLTVERNYYYDSLGQHVSQYSLYTKRDIDSPVEKGDTWSFAGVLRREVSEYSSLSGQVILSLSSSDFRGKYFDYRLYQDSLSLSDSNLFQGDKNNINLDLGLAWQSSKSGKAHLFIGVRNILSWEKQDFPDFLRFPPAEKYRNTFHRLTIPLAAEIFPWQKFAVRIGALPSYIFQKGYQFSPYSTSFAAFTSRRESLTYTLGFSVNPTRGLKVESYYLGSSPLDDLQSWNLGVTYDF